MSSGDLALASTILLVLFFAAIIFGLWRFMKYLDASATETKVDEDKPQHDQ